MRRTSRERHLGTRLTSWRRIAVCAGLVAVTFGFSPVSSAAQDRGMAKATQSAGLNVAVTVPIKRLPVIGHFYPKHQQFGGDREFNGHGPDIVATATLGGILTSRNLTVKLCMEAKETQEDHTRAVGCETYLLYQAPPGQCIGTVSHGASDEVQYIDNDHTLDEFTKFGSPNFVQKWEITGDTIEHDDAGDRTGVNIETFPISFTTGPGGCQ